MNPSPIRLFIGSSARNQVEERVLVYSIQRLTQRPLEVWSLLGDRGTVRRPDGSELPLPEAIRDRLGGATRFSTARYAIPHFCGYEGRAIYCDSDQILFTDLAELFDRDLGNAAVAAVPVTAAVSRRRYDRRHLAPLRQQNHASYLTSVMLLDCAQLRHWDPQAILAGLSVGDYSYTDLMFLGPQFCDRFGLKVQDLESGWNHLDVVQPDTKLLHFTDLETQPWRFAHHPAADLWEKLYLEAIASGALDRTTITAALREGGVCRRIALLPDWSGRRGRWLNRVWRSSSAVGQELRDASRDRLHRLKQQGKAIAQDFFGKKPSFSP
ncbi:hypothetical protein [Synechococcus elongatus]|uniref:hypothetical protein n=1 Tax=Synechococcus elongatus TaxID=32046 RepID=UPI000F7F1CFF|nr:hypothetical protein [Synechococcus elongatus]